MVGLIGTIILVSIMFLALLIGVIIEIVEAYKKEDYKRVKYILGCIMALVFFSLLFISIMLMGMGT